MFETILIIVTDVTHTTSFSLKRNDAGASWMGSHAGAWEPEKAVCVTSVIIVNISSDNQKKSQGTCQGAFFLDH
jgi:hypothetical protein